MKHLEAGDAGEPFAGEILRRADPRRGVTDGLGLRAAVLDELLQRGHAQRRMHGNHQRLRRELGDRREVVDGVVVGRRIEMRLQAETVGPREQRITVGGRLGREVVADAASRARLVVDHD